MVSRIEMGKLPISNISSDRPKNYLAVNRLIAERLYNDCPSWKGQAMPVVGATGGSVQVIRQIASALPRIGPKNHVVANSGMLCGSIGLFLGINDIHSGYADSQRAMTIQDREGESRAAARLLCGSISVIGSALVFGGKMLSSAAAMSLTLAAERLFCFGSAIAMGVATVGIFRCYRFRSGLNRSLKEASSPEVIRVFNALKYLKNSISVTGEEREKIVRQVDSERSSLEGRESKISRKIFDLTEVKIKCVKRRTSQKALFMIIDRVGPILAKLLDPKQQGKGVVEARQLIADIHKENVKKIILYMVVLIASTIGLVGFVSASFFSVGALPFILCAISSAIYLGLTVRAAYGQWKKQYPEHTETT